MSGRKGQDFLAPELLSNARLHVKWFMYLKCLNCKITIWSEHFILNVRKIELKKSKCPKTSCPRTRIQRHFLIPNTAFILSMQIIKLIFSLILMWNVSSDGILEYYLACWNKPNSSFVTQKYVSCGIHAQKLRGFCHEKDMHGKDMASTSQDLNAKQRRGTF